MGSFSKAIVCWDFSAPGLGTQRIRKYGLNLLIWIFSYIFFPGHQDKLLRSLVINRLGGCGDESLIAEAKRRFAAHLEGTQLIPADLRSAVYRAVMSRGDLSTYETMIQVLETFSISAV